MGVFNMPLNNLRIIVSNKALEMDKLLQLLISQFFTDDSLPVETLKNLLYQPWNSNSQNYDAEWTSKVHQTLEEIEADAKAKKKEPVRARFPVRRITRSLAQLY
jgi:LPS O-antigen subunit length determinant protein (WzzB/FepE family)